MLIYAHKPYGNTMHAYANSIKLIHKYHLLIYNEPLMALIVIIISQMTSI